MHPKIRNITLSLFCLLVLASNSEAADAWKWQDTLLEGTFVGLATCDALQTNYIGRHPEQMQEQYTILLSKHPTPIRTARLFVPYVATHIFIATKLDRPYRTIWQGLFIGFEGNNVRHNWVFGITIGL